MKKFSLLFLFSFCTAIAFAQEVQIIDTTIVSASRFKTSIQSTARNVIVLDRDEIESAPVESISDLLDFVGGVDSRQRGSFGTQTDLSIRGGSFEQVLVMIDGIRLSDPQTGHHLMNLPVDKSDIERIEILLGGGSYLHGSSSFSGSINIITKSDKQPETSLKAAYGSYNSYQAGVSQSLNGRNHNSLLSFQRSQSEGFKTNTDFEVNNLFAKSKIAIKSGVLNFAGGFNWKAFGAQNFYSNAYPDQFEKTKTLFANVGWSSGDKVKFDPQLYWRRNRDEFQLFREGEDFYEFNNGYFINGNDTAATFYKNHNYHLTDVAGAKIEVKFKSAFGNTAIAAEHRLEKIISNNLGDPLDEPIGVPNHSAQYNLGQQRQNTSIALEQVKQVGPVNLTAAFLINYNTAFETGFYPAISAAYAFAKNQNLYASVNKSFRLPSYTDLYYNLGGALGSINLQPENSFNYELGYKLYSKQVYTNFTIFRREGRDIIDWVQQCSSCDLMATNTSEVNFSGLDFSTRFNGFTWFSLVKLSFVEVSYSYLMADEKQQFYNSLYVYDYLKNKLTLRAAHKLTKRLNFTYALSYQDRNGTYTKASTGQEVEYPNVWLIDTRVDYQWQKLQIYLSAQNLLNKSYFDRGNVELPGIWVWSGINLKLHKN